jgi:uncharacterized protein with von Willebrand factor type A (vWA) domain
MSVFDELRARAEGLRKRLNARSGDERQVVRLDKYDNATWDELRAEVPVLGDHIADLADQYDYVDPAYRDLFGLLYKSMPAMRDADDMDARYRPNRRLIGELADLPQTRRLHDMTAGDEYATAMGLRSMQDTVDEAFERLQNAADKGTEAAQEREKAQDALDDIPGDDGEQPSDEELQDVAEALDEAEAALDAADALEAEGDRIAGNAVAGLGKAADEAADERAAEGALMHRWGVNDGELQQMSFQERFDLAESLRNNRLSEFADMIGAFRMIATGERRKRVVPSQERVVDIELGNNVERLIPAEWAKRRNPRYRKEWKQRFLDGELLQWRMDGSEILGRGPIIVCGDESSSMKATLGGFTREAWMKAVTLGLLDGARAQGRDFWYIGFSSANQCWPKQVKTINDVVELAQHFWSGGTNYEVPLIEASTLVEEYAAAGKPRPDVVLVTDDECKVDDTFEAAWNALRESTQMKCFGVQMGAAVNPLGQLARLCDNTHSLSDLSPGDREAAELFRLI